MLSVGEQTDASWKVNDTHTIRAGFQVIGERKRVQDRLLWSCRHWAAQVASNDGGGGPRLQRGTVGAAGCRSRTSPFNVHDGNGKTGKLYGVYLQDEWKVFPKLTVNYGLRYDRVEEYANGDQISPRVNVVYKPLRGHHAARGLLALLHAAAVRAGQRQRPSRSSPAPRAAPATFAERPRCRPSATTTSTPASTR